MPLVPPPAGWQAAPDGSGGGGGDGDGDGRGGGGCGDSGAVASPDSQRLAKLKSNAESASGAPAWGRTSGDRGGTGRAPRRPAEGDCRAPPSPPSVPVRRRPAALPPPAVTSADSGRHCLRPAAPAPLLELAPTCVRQWRGMSAGCLLCLSRPVAAVIGAPPAPPPRDPGGFLCDQATANQSYCWKNTTARAEQYGHGSDPMKIVKKHNVPGQQHCPRQSLL